jgi:hypothetical protein
MDELKIKKTHPELVEESELCDKDFAEATDVLKFKKSAAWTRAAHFMLKHATKLIRDPSHSPNFNSKYIDSLFEIIQNNIAKDGAARLSAGIISAYFNAPKTERKIYVFQPEFFRAFAQVQLEELTYEHLPRNAVGYVSLPVPVSDGYGHEFTGFYFYCGPVKEVVFTNEVIGCPVVGNYAYEIGDLCVSFGYVDTKGESFNYAFRMRPLNEKMTVRDSWRHSNWAEVDAMMRYKIKTMEDGYDIKDALFCNTLAYIVSGQPDLRHFRNHLRYRSPTSTKVVRADADFSREELVLLGYNYKKDPFYSAAAWDVKMHVREQAVGPGRQQHRLVWVKPHIRHRRVGADGGNDQGVRSEEQNENGGRGDRREPEHERPEVGSPTL